MPNSETELVSLKARYPIQNLNFWFYQYLSVELSVIAFKFRFCYCSKYDFHRWCNISWIYLSQQAWLSLLWSHTAHVSHIALTHSGYRKIVRPQCVFVVAFPPVLLAYALELWCLLHALWAMVSCCCLLGYVLFLGVLYTKFIFWSPLGLWIGPFVQWFLLNLPLGYGLWLEKHF